MMEMPAGWKKIDTKNRLKDSFSDFTVHSRYEIMHALKLMKEMAEALEFAESHAEDYLNSNNADWERRHEELEQKMKAVLKKFKEWK